MKKIQYIRTSLVCALACAAVLVSMPGCTCAQQEATEDAVAEEIPQPHRYGFEPDSLVLETGKVAKNQYFSNLMMKLGLSAEQAYNLTMACDTVFDVKKLRSGNPYEAYYSLRPAAGDTIKTLEYLVYERDALTDVVFRCTEPYEVWTSTRPIETRTRYAEVTIRHSLWQDMTDAGITTLLILKLSDIYAWTIDFFALQPGDNFRVAYDETLVQDKIVAVDTVRYAVFTHDNTSFPVIMYDQKDGGNIYWNERGESMRKQFLKAPLNYSRISSGFSHARRHPITRKVQPHTGVDYAAPAGTPVVSIGDGKVISAKNEGAGGNTVRIRHNSVYTTAYLHLSKFGPGIKAGAMVRQGDVIGYVGSTGRSTGPHLDFRVWKNGTPVNPLKMDSPPAEPVREENMADFKAVADSLSAIYAAKDSLSTN